MRIVAVEGTPEEIARLEALVPFLGGPDQVQLPAHVGNLPEQIVGFLDSRGVPAYRPYVERFLLGAIEQGTVLQPGKSKVTKDGLGPYLLIYDMGPRTFGAAAALFPHNGTIEFRLPHAAAAGKQFSRPTRQNGGPQPHKYQVRAHLGSDNAVEEALNLLKQALDIIRKSST